jgi:ketosteroid isomerase-like protein
MTDSKVAIVQRFSTAVRAGDFDEMGRLLHEDFVARESGGLPYSGDYHGLSGFRELLEKMSAAMTFDPGPFTSEPLGESAVALRFPLTFTAHATGKSVTMDLIEVYTLRDDKIVDLDVYYKDPAALTALLSEVPATPNDTAGTA